MSDPQVPYAQQPPPAMPPVGPPAVPPAMQSALPPVGPPVGPGVPVGPTYGGPPQGPFPGPPKKNFFARHKFLTVLMVVAALIVVGIGVGASGGTADNSAKPAASATQDAPSGQETTSSTDEPVDNAAGDGASDEKPAANDAKPGTRENPFPIDTPATLGDWTISVGASNTNATDVVRAENSFNDAPVEGRQFVLAPITMTYNGKDAQMPLVALSIKFVGAKGNTYASYDTDASCGVIPNDMMGVSELYAGATATANECMSIPADEIAGGSWVVNETFTLKNDKAFFAVG